LYTHVNGVFGNRKPLTFVGVGNRTYPRQSCLIHRSFAFSGGSTVEYDGHSQEIEHLKLVIEKCRRMIFGSKSEKLNGQLEQLEFRLEELETTQAATEAAQQHSTRTTTKSRSRASRKPLPEDLPREVITHLPARTCCPGCGGALRQFGEDVSEQLERVPATYKVIQYLRPKFACPGCERVVEAPALARPIEHGLPGPGLLAHVLVSKIRGSPSAVSAV
jgi:transposase